MTYLKPDDTGHSRAASSGSTSTDTSTSAGFPSLQGEDPLSLLGIPSPGAVATLAATKTGAALGSGPGAKQQGAAGAGGRGGGSNRAGEVPKGGVQDVGSEGDEEGQQDQGANDGTASKARAGGVGRSNSMLVRPSESLHGDVDGWPAQRYCRVRIGIAE